MAKKYNRNLVKKKLIFVILLILVLLVGAGIRIYRLDKHDLWFDEDTSLYVARDLNFNYMRPNPPLYYLLLNFWRRFFGESEFILRFFSVVFGVSSVFMIYKLGRLFFDARVGLISAFIISISPIHIWYSQEARGYTLSVFLIIITTYFFILALKENRNHLWASFIVSAILSIYTNYFSFLILFAGAIIISLKKYRWLIRKWLISYLFIVISFFPWWLSFWKDVVFIRENFWISKPSLESILITFENFTVGYNATLQIYTVATILFTMLFILGILYLRREKEKLIILLIFLFVPIIISFIFSRWIPIYLDRQLILFSPFYYFIVSFGLKRIKIPLIQITFFASILLLSTSSLYNYFLDFMPSSYEHHVGVHIKKPIKPVVKYIRENFNKGDIIAHSSFAVYNPFVNYWGPESINQYYFVILNAEDSYWRRLFEEGALRRKESKMIDLTKGIKDLKFKRIWLITSSWARDGNLDNNSSAVTEWMEKHYVKREGKEFDGIFVSLYEQRD